LPQAIPPADAAQDIRDPINSPVWRITPGGSLCRQQFGSTQAKRIRPVTVETALRRMAKPMKPKPISIIAHVAGSGSARGVAGAVRPMSAPTFRWTHQPQPRAARAFTLQDGVPATSAS
jgi:hypothetical protein